MGEKRYRYSLIQDGIEVAAVDAPTMAAAHRKIMHYAMMYLQNGPVSIKGDCLGVEVLWNKIKEKIT